MSAFSSEVRHEVRPIGVVESSLIDLADAPRQGDEGAPEAWLVIEPTLQPAIRDLEAGQHLVVLTLGSTAPGGMSSSTRPRDDPNRPEQGVFSTRSADRPNPIGLHEVMIVEVDGGRLLVRPLEAINGTPVIDIKPVLGAER